MMAEAVSSWERFRVAVYGRSQLLCSVGQPAWNWPIVHRAKGRQFAGTLLQRARSASATSFFVCSSISDGPVFRLAPLAKCLLLIPM